MKKLPTSIADFQQLRSQGYIYADNTELIHQLVKQEKRCFLSRPRRFGKSLLVSALENILKGRRELFEGLWIDGSDHDWSPRPVVKLSMDSVKTMSAKRLEKNIIDKLQIFAESEQLPPLKGRKPSIVFESLILKLRDKHKPKGADVFSGQKVAVLIDEYDAPITHVIADPALAEECLAVLNEFYGVLKTASDRLGFIFVAGVTKYDHASIFSALDHLDDLTLNERYSSICGFKVEEFGDLFSEHLENILEQFVDSGQLPVGSAANNLREAIVERYDGYSWDGKTKILNPWSVLKCLSDKKFKNYWSMTGAPTFLVDLVKERVKNFGFEKEKFTLSDESNALNLDDLDPIILLFQSGYLTIKRTEHKGDWRYLLGFPNMEVIAAMAPPLLLGESLAGDISLATTEAKAMRRCLIDRDAFGFQKACESFLGLLPQAGILPHDAYYHNIMIMALLFSGQELSSESAAAWGRRGIHFKAKETGDEYIIELKHLNIQDDASRETKKRKKKSRPCVEAEIKKLVDESLKQVMDQMEENLHMKRFPGADDRIWKAAIVFMSGGGVAAAFEEASNRPLVNAARKTAKDIGSSPLEPTNGSNKGI
ncbi:MAG: AAA family ATPase [Deltaproteobacteria bacterium]|jgi:hypothetical protein|nr:AAA family ATPase [Deltaproteobacteria bacterium]